LKEGKETLLKTPFGDLCWISRTWQMDTQIMQGTLDIWNLDRWDGTEMDWLKAFFIQCQWI